MKRNRSEGWKFAKNSGHLNEDMLANIESIPYEISNLIGEGEKIISINGAGPSQKKEMSVLGHKTTPKIDNIIKTNLRSLKISLKKSLSGQVLLTSSDNFFDTLEKMFQVKVNDDVRQTMKLFTGEDNEGVRESLKNDDVNRSNLKCSRNQRTRRLNGEALLKLNPYNTTKLLNFLSDNIVEITKMVFSTGSVKNKDFHVDYLYYKNLVNENKSADTIFNIKDILKNVSDKPIEFGPKFGGTTILLPFGHLQMHKNMLQIHHNYEKINHLIND